MRYELIICFKAMVTDLSEEFKTLREANAYKSIIDDTVERAHVYDKVTDKFHIWKDTLGHFNTPNFYVSKSGKRLNLN